MLKQILNQASLVESGDGSIRLIDMGEDKVRVGVLAPDPVSIALRKANEKTRKPRKKTLTELLV